MHWDLFLRKGEKIAKFGIFLVEILQTQSKDGWPDPSNKNWPNPIRAEKIW